MRSKNNRRIAILGSGVVSHLASKLLKDATIFTKRKTDIFLDNMFFHDTIENRLLLMICNTTYISKDVPVWYFNNNTKTITGVVTDEIRRQIAREKMGDATKPIVLSTMTDIKPSFTNLIFDQNELKNELLLNTNIAEIFPTTIHETKDEIILQFDDKQLSFDYLINTIPQPFFNPLLHNPCHESNYEFKYNPLVFVTNTNKSLDDDMMTYSYNNCFWKRIFVKNGIECIEFNEEDWDEERFKEQFPRITSYNVVKVPYGRIKSVHIPDTKRIKHIGRFAQWNHSITTEHSINKLLNLNL